MNLYAIATFLIGGEPVRTSMLANNPEYSTKKAIVAIKHKTSKTINAKIRKSDIMRQCQVKAGGSNYSLRAMSLNTVRTVNTRISAEGWLAIVSSLAKDVFFFSPQVTNSDSAAVTGKLWFLKSLAKGMEIYMPLGKRSILHCVIAPYFTNGSFP